MTFADEIFAATSPAAQPESYGNRLLRSLAPSFLEIVRTDLFSKLALGTLPVGTIRRGLTYIFPLIRNFPAYLQHAMAKVPGEPEEQSSLARAWLARNVALEEHHAIWFRDWAMGFGVAPTALDGEIQVPAEIAAFEQYLLEVSTGGSFVEAIAAVNLAVEGATGLWARSALDGVHRYADQPGVHLNKQSLRWLNAHASYDDRHAIEAIQMIESFATSRIDQDRAERAAQLALGHYRNAAEATTRAAGR